MTVLKPKDLKSSTPQEKAWEIVENRRSIFFSNFDHLLAVRKMSQASLCEKIDIPSPRISGYRKPDKLIPMDVIARVSNYFGLTIEQMTGEVLDKSLPDGTSMAPTSGRPAAEYDKYVGAYDLCFFNTDKPVGENRRITPESLAQALVIIYGAISPAGSREYHVCALMNCTLTERQEARKLVESCNLTNEGKEAAEYLKTVAAKSRIDPYDREGPRQRILYEGEIHLTDEATCLDLEQNYGHDVVRMMLHNRAANTSAGKSYKGGLGVILSLSRGNDHAPCIQTVLFSRAVINDFPPESIAKRLYLDCPSIDLQNEAEDLIVFFRKLYLSEEGSSFLSLPPNDKRYLVEQLIKKRLIEALKRNLLSYYKVSTEMDTESYRFLSQK